ncbi:MAG: hypothetical protein ACRDZ5_12540 [Acidimicrobiales bacterium]
MKQIITRVDDELADDLKRQAGRVGESVNSYVSRLLRLAVAGPGSPRQMWKAAAITDGRLLERGPSGGRDGGRAGWTFDLGTELRTPAGYAATLVSNEREER